jgi:hypothetical protein
MSTLVGLVIVFASVLIGFAMVGGPFAVLFQPSELVVICGAAFGSLFISAPGKVRRRITVALKHGFVVRLPKTEDYIELLKLLAQLFHLMRRDGTLALESHLAQPESSTIFSKYPSFMNREHPKHFLIDCLRQLVDGCTVAELTMLMDLDLETHHEEEHQPIALIRIWTVGPRSSVTTSPQRSSARSSESSCVTGSSRRSAPASRRSPPRTADTCRRSRKPCSPQRGEVPQPSPSSSRGERSTATSGRITKRQERLSQAQREGEPCRRSRARRSSSSRRRRKGTATTVVHGKSPMPTS